MERKKANEHVGRIENEAPQVENEALTHSKTKHPIFHWKIALTRAIQSFGFHNRYLKGHRTKTLRIISLPSAR